MGVGHTLVHCPIAQGGTRWTNAKDNERPVYEEALRRYQGPARIVLCDEAYLPPARDVLWGRLLLDEGTHPLVEWFSVHLVNLDELPAYDLTDFYTVLKQVRSEQGEGREHGTN